LDWDLKLHLMIERYDYGNARHIVTVPPPAAPDRDQVIEFINRVQLPPAFRLAPFPEGVILSYDCVNSVCPHQMEETNLFVHLPEDRDTWAKVLQASLWEAVMHEVDEYYKVDGVVVKQPHPELSPDELLSVNQDFMIHCEHYGELGICRPVRGDRIATHAS
jgi:hypothetical protein